MIQHGTLVYLFKNLALGISFQRADHYFFGGQRIASMVEIRALAIFNRPFTYPDNSR
ncbi:hypothetical protein A11S_1447 [Micavibrio aeruginosavorus EPB]|uniref:Uncharacterized protein n=1 Tax=Micavibrio aeruginosavorus EPB TaxID=349215 RepID=M4VJM1_9BACT|nr:hypothetical protein A11S_1447 [Micavibrio aeruginosavorus EPB]